MKNIGKFGLAALGALALCLPSPAARAFCGFYVGKADAKLFNEASQVVMARDGRRTVISMRNDYKGELSEFALVVPVPVVLQRDQVGVGDSALFDRLDAFTAPRLVEYFDPDHCAVRERRELLAPSAAGITADRDGFRQRRDRALGVTVEAAYTVGEYDIVILSARQSGGREVWLWENGYRVPKGASRALKPYIRQGLKFFVAKVNLEEQVKTGYRTLRPLQFAFESEKFMLPLRLGMLNAEGPQDLVAYLLTRRGRVESTNYRTVFLPAGEELPEYVAGEFKDFYRDMFRRQWEKEDRRVVFTEHFWNLGWCDPCASDSLTPDELRRLGVFWLDEEPAGPKRSLGAVPVQVTRLHVRYEKENFPEDLFFHETKDPSNFQCRYVLRHPWKGGSDCPQAQEYRRQVKMREEKQARTLASLTGWDVGEIRRKMGLGDGGEADGAEPWWRKIWN